MKSSRFRSKLFYSLTLVSLLLGDKLDAQPRQRKQITAVASIGDAVMKEIDLALPDELYQGYLFWHQADELASDVVNYAMLLDTEGKIVHRWDTDLNGGGHTSYLLNSGGLLRTGIRDRRYVVGQPVAATDTLQITDKTEKANDHGITFRDRVFNPLVTIWGFLSQVLSQDHSCRDAVSRIVGTAPPSAKAYVLPIRRRIAKPVIGSHAMFCRRWLVARRRSWKIAQGTTGSGLAEACTS